MLKERCALRAAVFQIGSALKANSDAGIWADIEISLVLLFLLQPLGELVHFLPMELSHEVFNALLVECPVGDVPSLLAVLLSVIGDQVLVVEPIEDVSHLVDIPIDLVCYLEIRNVLLVF